MDTLPSEEEQMLKNVAREFLEAEVSTALVREMELDNLGYPPVLWQRMADLGWLGLAIPEEHGGQGLPLTYLGLVLEEAGRVLAPVPLHSTMVTALAIAGMILLIDVNSFIIVNKSTCFLIIIIDLSK